MLLISVCVGSASLNAADALRLLLAKVPGMGGLMDTEGIGEEQFSQLYKYFCIKVALALKQMIYIKLKHPVIFHRRFVAPTVYYVSGYGESGDYTAGGDTYIGQLLEAAGF